jgi:hypothetical protein
MVQVKDKSEYIVYVPRADKYTYGTIKIGDGLISDDGVISVDDTQIVAIKTIAKNGVEIKPDENRQVNIVLTKADVGLNNVNNTADLDKPISTATQAAIDKLSHDLMDDVMNVQESLDDYKLVVDNKFAEQKSDVDGRLLVINNTISQNKIQTDSAIERIEEVLEGKEQSVAFTNYQTVVNAFNMAATNKYNVGQSIYVQSINVPDLWVYSIENTHVDFAYIGDEDIIEKLETNGTVQFGYYKLAMMETKTTSVANAVTLDTEQTIIAPKIIKLNKIWANFDDDIVSLIYKGDARNSVIYIDNKVQVGSTAKDGTTFYGMEHDAANYTTNFIGVLQHSGQYILDMSSIEDSDSVVVDKQLNKIKLELKPDITNKLQKALIIPMSAPSTTELVAIDDGNSQTMIEIGDGLILENGTLKATGGGGGSVDTTNLVTINTTQEITSNKTFKDGIVVEKQKTNSNGSTTTRTLNFGTPYFLTIKNSAESRYSYMSTNDYGGWFIGSRSTNGATPNQRGIDHTVTGVTNITGTLQYNGVEVATKNDITSGSPVTIVDNLTTDSATEALSARQGKVLYDLIGDVETLLSEV